MTDFVPIVDYLVLGERPHLLSQRCDNCGAHYFDRRDACAACFNNAFSPAVVGTTGLLETFTIVTMSGPDVPVPFVAGVVDCQGISVRTNIINVEPSPDAVKLGMALQLATFSIGVDDNGVTAVGFGYEPATNGRDSNER